MMPPTFQRAPRRLPEIPKAEVEIPAPPPMPNRPTGSLLAIILPGILALAALVVTASTAAMGNLAMSLLSFVFMGVTSLTALISYLMQRSGYSRAVRERADKYRALLETHRQQLVQAWNQQQMAQREIDPEPRECLARAEQRDRRLWERAPQDPDFLTVRLGLGKQPFGVTIKTPKHPEPTNPDALIQEAEQLAASFAHVPEVPLGLPLRDLGVAGLAGPRFAIVQTARALALQIATHHSPDEVKIVALFPNDERPQWDWLRWLPHVWTDDRHHRWLACEKESAHRLLDSLHDLLERRATSNTAEATLPSHLPHFVFLLADPSLYIKEPVLPLLLNEGKRVGAYALFLADRSDALPRQCQAIVELEITQPRLILLTGAPSVREIPFEPDRVSVEWADRLARALAPLRLQRAAAPSEIPATVTLLDLLGVERVEDLDVLARWQASEPFKSLAVPLGKRTGDNPLFLNLHERGHGPHGLVAGTSGSGKSELLQSLVASLAVHFHPHDVAFVLVDYKGGGMANAFQDLPHLVGTITNLQGTLAIRALTSLKAELQRRQRLFEQARVNHIDDYQKKYRQKEVAEPLPHLVLIVDEFAELKADQPDFMRELISAVRVGRSLGVHLILATQKPAGVVDEQIWANSRFRLCLRVERPEDSQEVLKRPDAADLTQPGRAYLQVGNNELFELFQAAWGGAPYAPGMTAAADEIVEVALDGTRHSLRPSSRPVPISVTGSQLQALVAYLHELAQREGIARLRGPWLPPLPEQVWLDEVRPPTGWNGQTWLPEQEWLRPVIGLVDDPAAQAQYPLAIHLAKEGHLAVYGAPGTGKTTFLQTLITSLALTYSPQDVNLYLLDFGGRLLTLFAPLPHVGGVVLADETERVNRLLRFLLRELESRKERFARAGVGNLPAYRTATGDALPAIVVMIDNYATFAAAYADNEDQLAQIAREGGNLGIHLVLTATSPSAIKMKISSNITLAVALQLADASDYATVVGRTGGLVPAAVVGRGLIKGTPPLEFQTALPASGATDAERTTALKHLIRQMEPCQPRARAIPTLPDVVALADLIPPSETYPPLDTAAALAVPLGLDVEDLTPVTVDLYDGPHFIIAGPAQSGKTTLLQSWLIALAHRFPPARAQLYLVDFRRAGLAPLEGLPHVGGYIEDDDRLSEALDEIVRMLRERRSALEQARRAARGIVDERAWLAHYPALVIAIDDFGALKDNLQMGTKERLEQLIRHERGLGLYVLLASASSDLASAWDGWVKALKEMQTGFLLGSSDHSDLSLFNIKLPLSEAGKALPPGQGYFTRRGRYRKIKVASSQAGVVNLSAWVDMIQRRARG